ncbi:MAG: hypothetical protein ACI9XR_000399 [Flavobacterium sp.]|jgi:hypothetical protein
MKNIYSFLLFFFCAITFAQFKVQDSVPVFKKKVLESTEVDILLSYYNQDGIHSAVSGGNGTEKLTDIATNIIVAIPMNADDILTIDTGISAYTSASSSNINPFDSATPTPWQSSSGASEQDNLVNVVGNYSHSSDDRNFIWNADISASTEYDYTSFGFGGGIAKLFNEKNTEFNIKANVYLDKWSPIYPKELVSFIGTVYDQNGMVTNGFSNSGFSRFTNTNRNSYSLSLGFSQILSKKLQVSFFLDILGQNGLLSTPYHRVYFADKPNYYAGNPTFISNYSDKSNTGVFQLADALERLPDTRFKTPFGIRLNYYVNERFKVRTYYRFYTDDWGISSHTASIELPIKLNDKFTVYPMYRYYTQTQSKYFAGYEQHLSTQYFYTSDYDLSGFSSNQYGMGLTYVDIFTKTRIWKFGLKSIDFRYNNYQRSDTLSANIFTLAFKFIM